MAIPISSAEPMVHIVFNNSLISFPLLSGFTALLIAVLIIFFVIYGLIKKLPEHIYKRLEKKIDKETELLKIIRSQVEPQKIDAYLAITESHGELAAIALADLQNLSPDKRKSQIEQNKALFILLSRLFFFASDITIEKYISFRNNATSSESVKLLSSPSLILYADLMVSMRQDLHSNTQIKANHFCSILGINFSEKE